MMAPDGRRIVKVEGEGLSQVQFHQQLAAATCLEQPNHELDGNWFRPGQARPAGTRTSRDEQAPLDGRRTSGSPHRNQSAQASSETCRGVRRAP